MARSGTCPACSAKLARHAAYCSSCGQAIGVDVDLSALEDDDELGGPGLDGAEPDPAPPLARTRNLLVGVGLAVALDRRCDPGEQGRRRDHRGHRRHHDVVERPAAVAEDDEGHAAPADDVGVPGLVPKGPLLPAPTGTVLYGTTSDGQLARIVLDTGEISLRRLPEGTNPDAVMQLIPRTGSIVVVGFPGEHSYVVPRGLKGEIVELELENEQVFRGPGPDELWRVTSSFSSPSASLQQVQLMKIDGTPVGPVRQLALQVYLEDGAGGLIGRGPGGYYVFAPEDGRPSLLSDGEMVSVDAQRIVDLVCDDVLTCRLARSATGPVESPGCSGRHPTPASSTSAAPALASPDGRWVAFDDGGGRLHVLDLQSGVIEPDRDRGGLLLRGFTWSADSSWLFWSENGSLRAWQLGVAEPVRIGGGSTPSLNTLVAVPAAEG